MARNNTIRIKGEFDTSQILASIQEMRKQLSKVGITDQQFEGFDKELKKAIDLSNQLAAQMQKGFSNSKQVDSFGKSYERLSTTFANLQNQLRGLGEQVNFNPNTDKINQLQKDLDSLKDKRLQLVNTAKEEIANNKASLGINQEEVKQLQKQVEKAEELEAILTRIGQERTNKLRAKASELDMGRVNTTAGVISSNRVADLQNITGSNSTNVLQAAYEKALNITTQNLGSAEMGLKQLTKELSEYNITINDNEEVLKLLSQDINATIGAGAGSPQAKGTINRMRNRVTQLGDFNTDGQFSLGVNAQNLISNTGGALEENLRTQVTLQQQLNQAIQQGELEERRASQQFQSNLQENINSTQQLDNSIEETTNQIREQAETQNSLNNSFENMKNAIKTILSIGSAWSAVQRVVKQTFEDIKNLDKAFASIAMVTNKTVGEMWSSYNSYADMAKRLGQNTQDAIKASALFYQQGLDTAEALSLTEDTMKLATLSGQDFQQATQQMTAALRGFHMEMEEGSHITDVYSELAANAAADVHGIAYAMSKTASIANSAGMSFENTSAFLAQMIETTQEAPENIGTAMKTIIARFTELKENVAGTADSEFNDLDYNKVDKALKTVGVSLKDASGQFRNLDDVFLELSSKWNTLDRNSQRYIATIAAGSRQQSRFIAMMENYERTMELVETAQDSAGRSEEQFAKYQDTVEYKLNQLKTTWEELRVSLANSDEFKKAIDLFTQFVEKFSDIKISDLVVIGVIGITVGKMFINNFVQQIQNTATTFQTIGQQMGNSIAEGMNTALRNRFNIPTQEVINQATQQYNNLNGRLANMQAQNSMGYNVVNQSGKSAQLLNYLMKHGKESQVMTYAAQAGYGTNDINTLRTQLQSLADIELRTGQTIQHTQQVMREQGEVAIDSQAKLQSLEQGFNNVAMSATVFITTLVATKDVESAFKSMLNTLTVTLIQMGLQYVAASIAAKTGGNAIGTSLGTGINEGLAATGTGIIVVAIATAVALIGLGLTKLYKNYQATHKSLQYQIDDINKQLEEAEKRTSELKNQAKESKETAESTKKLKDDYEELSKLTVRTTEQEERYNEVISEINNQLPQVVTYYNEVTGELRVQNELWDSILQKQKEQATKDRNTYLSASLAEGNLKATQLDLQYEQDQVIYKNFLGSQREADIYNNFRYKQIAQGVIKTAAKWNILGGIGGIVNGLDDKYKWSSKLIADEETKGYLAPMAKVLNLDTENINDVESMIKVQRALNGEQIKLNETEQEYLKTIRLIQADEKERTDNLEEQKDIIDKQLNLQRQGYIQDYAKNTYGEFSLNEVIANTLAENDYLKDYDENVALMSVRDYVDKGFLNLDNIEGQTLSEKIKNFNKLIKDKDKDAINSLQSAYQASLMTEDLSKILANVSDADREQVEYLLEQMQGKSYSDLNDKDFQEDLAKDVKPAIRSYFIQAVQNMANEADTNLQNIGNLSPELRKDVENFQVGQIQSVMQSIQSVLDDQGASAARDYSSQLSNIIRSYNLSGEQLGQLINDQGWEQATSYNWKKIKENIINNLTEAGIIGAEQLVDEIVPIMSEAGKIDIVINNETELDEFIEKMDEIRDKTYKEKDTFISVITKQITEGKVALDDYIKLQNSLKELGLNVDDYAYIDAYGNTIIDTEALKNAYLDTMKAKEQELEFQLQCQEAEMNTLRIEIARLKTLNQISRTTELDIIAGYQKGTGKSEEEAEEYVRTLFGVSQETIDEQENALKTLEDAHTKTWEELQKTRKETAAYVSDYEQAQAKAIEEANKKKADAMKKLADAEEKVTEAEKKLQETLYGTENHKNKLDYLYNYATNLDRITKSAEKAKEALSDLQEGDDPQKLLQDFLGAAHAEVVTRTAENQIIQQSIDNYKAVLDTKLSEAIAGINANGKNLSTNISDYYTQYGDRLNVNFSALNAAQLPDEITDYVETTIEEINKLSDQMESNQDSVKKKEKEFIEFKKQIRDNYIKLEDQVVNTLKQKYDEEIKATEDKNKALEESDNEYLDALEDAIKKQRDLRENANKYDDLAKKEAQLALMQRDTSGSRRSDALKLEEEIEKDRTQLLDDSVDKMIESLKDMYELQKETRDAEVEYQKAVLDNAILVQEANAIIEGWNSADDAVAWFYENTKDLSEMSVAKLEQETESWRDLYEAKQVYMEASQLDFNQALQFSADEVQKIVESTSQTLTDEADRSLNEITTTVKKAIKDAEKALEDAIRSLQEAQQATSIYNSTGLNGNSTFSNGKTVNDLITNKNDYTIKTSNVARDAASYQGKIAQIGSDVYSFDKLADFLGKNYSDEDVDKLTYALGMEGKDDQRFSTMTNYFKSKKNRYASGGIVDYTGPAWVDGTFDKPEAFLSPEDTERISKAAQLLSMSPLLSTNNTGNVMTTNVGDTSIEININVENISDDYSVDQMIERVKQEVVNAYNPIGSSVILRNR